MFKETTKETQLGLFFSAENLLSGIFKSFYEGATATCHNVFLKEVPMRIDKGIFSKLYSSGMNTLNSSIRILIAMKVLKQAHGGSANQLLEARRYHTNKTCFQSGFKF